jgi:hypothetical protein
MSPKLLNSLRLYLYIHAIYDSSSDVDAYLYVLTNFMWMECASVSVSDIIIPVA